MVDGQDYAALALQAENSNQHTVEGMPGSKMTIPTPLEAQVGLKWPGNLLIGKGSKTHGGTESTSASLVFVARVRYVYVSDPLLLSEEMTLEPENVAMMLMVKGATPPSSSPSSGRWTKFCNTIAFRAFSGQLAFGPFQAYLGF